jgi:opacity protein-like surface antigen
MKKIITFILLSNLITAKLLASPYMGIDLKHKTLSYTDPSVGVRVESDDYYKKDLLSLSPFVGYELNDNISIELSYFTDNTSKANNNTGLYYISGDLAGSPLKTRSNIDLNLISLDLIQSKEINKDFSLLGIIGLSHANFSFKEYWNDKSTYSAKENSLGLNLGLGLTHKLNEKISLRTKAKYTLLNNINPSNINGIGKVDNILTLQIGVKIDL